jgi:hypothetical protein
MAKTVVKIPNAASAAVAIAVISAERSLEMGEGYAAGWPPGWLFRHWRGSGLRGAGDFWAAQYEP